MIRFEKNGRYISEIRKEPDGTTRKWKARSASIDDVRESIKDSYEGPDICILHEDWSDSCIHENGITLEECESYNAEGCLFFFDEDVGNKEKVFHISEYGDFVMVLKDISEGSDATVTDVSDRDDLNLSIHLCIITKVIARSDDADYYDGHVLDWNGDYDYSAEFVTDDDIYCVYVQECDHL